jgi:hypothetical protein
LKTLANRSINEQPSYHRLGYHLAFTKCGQEP